MHRENVAQRDEVCSSIIVLETENDKCWFHGYFQRELFSLTSLASAIRLVGTRRIIHLHGGRRDRSGKSSRNIREKTSFIESFVHGDREVGLQYIIVMRINSSLMVLTFGLCVISILRVKTVSVTTTVTPSGLEINDDERIRNPFMYYTRL